MMEGEVQGVGGELGLYGLEHVKGVVVSNTQRTHCISAHKVPTGINGIHSLLKKSFNHYSIQLFNYSRAKCCLSLPNFIYPGK